MQRTTQTAPSSEVLVYSYSCKRATRTERRGWRFGGRSPRFEVRGLRSKVLFDQDEEGFSWNLG